MSQVILQLIAAIFALFALSRVYLRFKEKKLSSISFIFWVIIWLCGVAAILFPSITTEVAGFVGIGRGVDAILYASIIVLFYLIFRLYVKIEDTQRLITEVARKIALDSLSRDKETVSSRLPETK